MKGTEIFQNTIKVYLNTLAAKDKLFAVKYENKKKSIKDCVTYILNQVKESGANGFTDDEVYGLAVHYYDETSIDIGKEITMDIAVNHHVEFTDEDRKEIKSKAMEKEIEKAREALSKPKTVSKPKEASAQGCLF